MGRLEKDFRLKKRGKYWYVKLKGQQTFKSTGETAKTRAEWVAVRLIAEGVQPQASEITFEEYAEPFFDWERCPHIRRLFDEGYSITKNYAKLQRLNLKNHILSTKLREKTLGDIRRKDIIDFRTTLHKKKLSTATVQKIMGALKVIFNEAYLREDLMINPVDKVGDIKVVHKQRDALSESELRKLFPEDYATVWRNEMEYTCFLLTAMTGMRRGEVLALKWRHIHFDANYISIEEAWKDPKTIGLPKSNRPRAITIGTTLKDRLISYRESLNDTHPDQLLFCYTDGTRLGDTWWTKSFNGAIRKSEIDVGDRQITPHCLRHTLNTLLRSKGQNRDIIRASLGWSDQATQDGYTHWKPEHMKDQAQAIDNLLADGLTNDD